MKVKDYPNVHAMLKETVDRYSEQTAYKWFVDAGRTEMDLAFHHKILTCQVWAKGSKA